MTPAFAGLVGGAFISTDALPAPPDALFYAAVGGKPGILAPGAVSGSSVNFGGGAGNASASTTDTLTASADAAGGPGGGDSSIANIAYFGEVIGSSTTAIPLSIIGNLSTSYGGGFAPGETSTGAADASMAWGIADSYSVQDVTFAPGLGGAEACLGNNPCVFPAVVPVNAVFDVDVNQIFAVAIQVEARAGDGAAASASADPIISILPDFLVAHPGLSLELSANVIQPSSGGSIPEPSTWAMMLLGFTGLGFAGYRKAKTARTVFSTL